MEEAYIIILSLLLSSPSSSSFGPVWACMPVDWSSYCVQRRNATIRPPVTFLGQGPSRLWEWSLARLTSKVHVSSYLSKQVAHTGLPSVGFRSWYRFLAVSLQVTWVINPAVGCHYFPPGLQLPPQPLRGLLWILLLGEQRHNGFEQFA